MERPSRWTKPLEFSFSGFHLASQRSDLSRSFQAWFMRLKPQQSLDVPPQIIPRHDGGGALYRAFFACKFAP